MPSVSPGLAGALTDTPREFIFDGGPTWRVEDALDAAHRAGTEDQISVVRASLEASQAPATRLWFGQRLASLFVLFNPTRDVDDRAFRIWNDEMTSLLIDLPYDIAAFAIDEAIRESTHGFAPSVGEIRVQAKPLLAQRLEHIDRLSKMEAALADPVATEERVRRRADQAAHAAVLAKHDDEKGRREKIDAERAAEPRDWRRPAKDSASHA